MLFLILLLPFAVAPSVWLWRSSYQKWENLTWVNRSIRVIGVVVIPLVLIPAFAACIFVANMIWPSSQGTVDPGNYMGSVQSWPFPSHVDHFPDQVPQESNPSFYYMPKVMQGWGHIYLEVKRPPGDVQTLVREAKRRAVYVSTWTDEEERVVQKNVGEYDSEDYPSPDFFGNEAELVPREHYVAYYYGGENTSSEDWWNHGYIYGVAFHKHKRRVSYWAKRW